ncbi:MAG TPA: CheR family methyltransferase, partial [Steroidobacteraceae bacterium]|nr:CheR family methyltransferase [Steroidobacteraceae bacterium]
MNSAKFSVVGLGASAGGLDAFRNFFAHLPPESGMAFVTILHLPADGTSVLREILGRWTSMPVVHAADGTLIEPNRVYVPPPHSVVTLAEGRFRIEAPDAGDRVFRPIDTFFDSLATSMRQLAVGVVLSGTGSDGALGLKAIRQCGGLTIAQRENGAAPQYGEMPARAIATGSVDLIAPVEEIPGHLLRLQNVGLEAHKHADAASGIDAARLAICTLLRTHVGHDFSGYRSQTFLRRVGRRMAVVNAATLEDYTAKLKDDPAEIGLLFRDLLIRVTGFFRDQETFQVLADKVIPQLFAGRMADATVRVWVPGCATGEEAYSLAILLREQMDRLPICPKVQVFATDIDDAAIETARLGRYPTALLEGMSEPRLRRFFRASHAGYNVAKEIRELCTFAAHNLVRDPPFSMMSLVSCRNLLIYMNPELQARIVPLFHYALIPGGILLLGGSESVAHHSSLFETIDKTARIFRRLQGRSPELNAPWQRPGLPPLNLRPAVDTADSRRILLQNESRTLPMSKRTETKDNSHAVNRYERLLGPVAANEGIVGELQTALASTCEQLQSLGEEYQTAIEELRSSNEELHSVNEELQSTNEELETSKEELQSLNEELHTVNLRLTEKVDELDQANSDLRNLFESTQIATVFLDRHLIIRSFTPAIATIFNLIPSDHGRPLTDIVSHLKYQGIREDIAFVLSSLEPLERRVDRDDGKVHYIMRVLPYREPDSSASGVLVTFVDVTSIVEAEEALVAADVRKDVFLATLSHELRNPLAPIRIAAQLLRSPKLDPGDLQHAQTIISRQVAHMSTLLDDLLDVARITRGAFLLKKEYVDVQVLIDDAIVAVQPAINLKEHTLRVDRPSAPIKLEVDPVRITQAITNLLTNAAKYTPKGGLIHMGSRLDGNRLVIYVRDNGVGLSAEALTKVFDMFSRVESEVGRSEGGLGIGLALAKGLIELHGGRIEARSAGPNQGSDFSIYLPRTVIVDESTIPASKPDGGIADAKGPLRILIADDNRDNAETLRMLLQLSGHEVLLAHSGLEALESATRARPDVGIFDIGMPDLTGYELAERIRHEAWGKDLTLIALPG